MKLALVALALASTACALPGSAEFSKRQASKSEQASIVQLAKSDPLSAAKKVLTIKNLNDTDQDSWAKYNNLTGSTDSTQVPWAPWFTKFRPSPSVKMDDGESYSKVPSEFYMFETKHTTLSDKHGNNATQPYYINKNLKNVKRAVMIWPGYHRDSYNYINMVGNAYNIYKKKYDVDDGSIALVAPYVLNQKDKSSGAVKDDWIYYKDDNFSVGGVSHGPGNTTISAFTAMDDMIDLMAKKYPNIEKFVVLGHSLGAQTVLRYAIVNHNRHDDKTKYWIGNPGTYTYLNTDRPLSKKNCSNYDRFPAGLGSNLPTYVGSAHRSNLTKKFLARDIRLAQGLNDNGVSSDSCDTMAQGHNRLERSAYFVKHIADVNGGKLPKSFSLEYVEGVSHQNYPMFAAKDSLPYIFRD
ncbi:hypothetical protein MCAP1_002790 [Malassezia caprae]|uniref:Uncharacterized protein n=1 Tax=Malassezia caprae TaxID=1381934 RepID=A0AAF0IXH6_9BASI|nr:hypothetical protein MCAP1_002790 [Malassezia caprae]